MENKMCIKCGEEKPLTNEYWHSKKKSKDGYRNECKACMKGYQAKYYRENKEKICKARKERYGENKEKELERNKCYYEANKEEILEKQKIYYESNKEKIIEYQKGYYEANKTEIAKRQKQYNEANSEYILDYQKRYYKENKEEISKRHNQYYHENKDKLSEIAREYYKKNREEILNKQKQYYKVNRKVISIKRSKYVKANRERYRQHWHNYIAKKKQLLNTLTINEWNEIKKHFDNNCAYCGMTEDEHYNIYGEQLHQDHFKPISKGGAYEMSNIIPSCRSCNSSKHNNPFEEWYPSYEHYNKTRESEILKYIKSFL